jgi:peptidoglycan/xylan/chitin deacetylase (PgdA/CDA1 family)
LLSASGKKGGIILCFHKIAPEKSLSWVRGLSQRYKLVSLDEMTTRRIEGRSLARLLAITFDDGWAETCKPVAEICEREKWPITIYVMSSLFDDVETFWFAEIDSLICEARGKRIENDGMVLDLRDRAAACSSRRDLNARLRAMPNTEALQIINRFRALGGLPAAPGKSSAFIDPHFLRQYANSEWVSFGSHSVDHQSLSSQSEAKLNWQLEESKNRIEEIINKPVKHFCYPYGDPEAIGKQAHSLVGRYYCSATTMIRGVCRDDCDLWYLPRIPLYDIDTDLRFLMKVALAAWA